MKRAANSARLAGAVMGVLLAVANAKGDLIIGGGTTVTVNTASNVTGQVVVGDTDGNNRLAIVAPGTLSNSGNACIGQGAAANGNTAVVNGAGAKWTLSSSYEINVGDQGSQNTLIATNGGWITSSPAGNENYGVGATGRGDNNRLIVTGSDSRFFANGAGYMYVGKSGADGCELIVANGGWVRTQSASGFYAQSKNGRMLVDGGKVEMDGSGAMTVFADDFAVTVTNGGQIISDGIFSVIGHRTAVAVSGSGSKITLPAGHTLQFGRGFDNQRISISRAGRIEAAVVQVGAADYRDAMGTVMLVDSGVVACVTSLYVGNGNGTRRAAGTSMIVKNGGLIDATTANGYVGGSYANCSNNTALLSDPGSAWNTANLTISPVGNVGSRVTVSNAATLAVSGTLLVNTNGTLALFGGHVSAGNLEFRTASTLCVQIGGVDPGSFDAIAMTGGDLILAGKLSVATATGFDSGSWTVVSGAGSRTGEFDDISEATALGLLVEYADDGFRVVPPARGTVITIR